MSIIETLNERAGIRPSTPQATQITEDTQNIQNTPSATPPAVATLAERETWLASRRLAWVADDADYLRAAVAGLQSHERRRYHDRIAGRLAAGEPADGLEWRALVDVRREFGHWRGSIDAS